MPFKQFIEDYMSPPAAPDSASPLPERTGYLAQHDLFAQVPALRNDICIPDYCYSEPPPSPCDSMNPPPQANDAGPLLNAWFGPAHTISPLHHDPHHNIFAQVVGYKYIRLYAPAETPRLYPRGRGANGVDMSNTSRIEVEKGMHVWEGWRGWDGFDPELVNGDVEERKREWEAEFPQFREARYVECVLGPGECLYIPRGWWHYVRSLSPSFSVSFWWD
jgi:lysine-specific demethylase 8